MEETLLDLKIYLAFIGVFIGVVHAFLPMAALNEKIFKIESKENYGTFSKIKLDFISDYDRENPVTETLAKEDNLKEMLRKVIKKKQDERKKREKPYEFVELSFDKEKAKERFGVPKFMYDP